MLVLVLVLVSALVDEARARAMPFVQITWLPKACRNAAVRKEVADAVLKAMCAVKGADVRHTSSPLAP